MLATDVELADLVETIHAFPLSADFLNWLSNGNFNQEILHEELTSGKYRRNFRYTIDGLHIFYGIAECILTAMNQNVAHSVTSQSTPYRSSQLVFSNARKKPIASHLTESHYSVITELYSEQICCGTSWEIYDIPNILHFYQSKEDPLSYWKSNRKG